MLKVKKYIVDEERLRELLEAELKLQALEFGGVDNWCDYGASLDYYREDYGDISDLAEQGINNFKKIEGEEK